MGTLTLKQANGIIEAIIRRGNETGTRPLSVVVVEPGCVVKAFQKEDGSSMVRFEMAFGKAYAALALGRSSSLVRIRNEEKPAFMQYLFNATDHRIFPEGGGALIRSPEGEVIGAVGVTGDTRGAGRRTRLPWYPGDRLQDGRRLCCARPHCQRQAH